MKSQSSKLIRLSILAIAVLLSCDRSAQAANTIYTWSQLTTGTYDWNTGANWLSGTAATGAGNIAGLKGNNSVSEIVDLSSSITIGAISRAGSQTNFTITGTNGSTITMDGTGITTLVSSSSTPGTMVAGEASINSNQNNSTFVTLTVNPNIIMLNTNLGIGGNLGTNNNVVIGGSITNGDSVTRQLNFRGASTNASYNTQVTGSIGATLGAGGGGIAIQNLITGSGAVNLTGAVGGASGTGAAITITNSATGTGAFNISGPLGQTVSSVVQSSTTSTMVLSGTNSDFTGTTTVSSGVLRYSNSAALPGGASRLITVNSGGVASAGYAIDQGFLDRMVQSSTGAFGLHVASSTNLDFTGFTNASLAASAAVIYSGTLTPNAQAYRVGGGTAPLTIASALNDSGGATSLTKVGTDTVILTASNGYSNGTTVSGGILQVINTDALPNYNAAGKVSLTGGTLVVNYGGGSDWTSSQVDSLLSANGAGFGSGSALGFDTTNGSGTYSGTISGSGVGVAKFGTGVLTLLGSNTYTGTTTVGGGTLKAGVAGAFGNNGALAMSGSGTLDLAGFNASFKDIPASASTNTITTTGSGSGTDTLTISNISSATVTSGALFADNGVRKLALNFTSSGAGAITATTNTANTYSGGLILNSAMRIKPFAAASTIGSPGAIVSGPFGRGTITLNGTTTNLGSQIYFDLSGYTLVNDVIVNSNVGNGGRVGSIRVTGTSGVISGSITANAVDAVVGADNNGAAITLTGTLTGAKGFTFNQSGGTITNWTATLNNAAANNDYAGNTTVNSGQTTLKLGAANQIPNGAGKGNLALTVGIFDMNGFSETINGLVGSGTVNNVAAVNPTNTLTLGDGDATASFSGRIINTTGTLGLTKIGNGVQSLSGTNSYSGGTNVNAGTLDYLNTDAKPASGTTTVAANATLGLGVSGSGSFFTSTDLDNYLSGTVAGNLSNVTWTGTSNLGIDTTAGNFAYATNIGSVTRALTKLGTNTLTLSGTNAYTGPTTISAGTLSVGVTENLGAAAANLVFDGGTLQVTGTTLTSISGLGHTVSFNSGKTVGFDINSAANTFTSDQVLNQGTGGLTKSGSGALTLSGSNSYTGLTTLSAGTLNLNNAYSIGGNGGLTISGGAINNTSAGAVTLSNAGTVTLGANFGFGGTRDLAFNGITNQSAQLTLTMSGTANLGLGDLTNTLAGNQILNVVGNTNGTVTIGNLALSSGTTNRNFLIGNNGASSGKVNITGVISNGGGSSASSFSVGTGGGTNFVTLSGSNTYTGATTISGGTVSVANTSNLGAPAANLVFDGGTLQITGTTLNDFSGIGHTVSFNSGKTVALDMNSASNTFTADQILNQGTGGLTKSGSGMLILPLANSYTGETRINAGTLRVDNASALSGSNSIGFGNIVGGAATLNNNTGGTLTLDKAFFRSNGNNTSGFVTGGAIVFNGLAANALNSSFDGLGVNNAGVTFAGGLQLLGDAVNRNFTLSGSGSILVSGNVINGAAYPSNKGTLTYNGSGSLTLSGTANTYSGGMTLTAGTLNLNNETALGVTGTFNIASNTTLNNTSGSAVANLNNNPINVNGNFTFTGSNDLDLGTGPVALGAATRTITTNASNLTLGGVISATGTFGITKAGAGTLTLNGSNTYTGKMTVNNGTLQFGVSETLTGGLTVGTSGTAVLTAHTGGAANVKVLDITGLTISGTTPFVGDGGKDLGGMAALAPVPEPGTIGLLAMGAIGGAILLRRNRRSGTR